MASKADAYLFTGTFGQLVSMIQTLAVTPPSELGDNWIEITHPAQKANTNRITYQDSITGLKIEFDPKVSGAKGFKGKDHYHINNPKVTCDKDMYLDINGNPCAKNSKESHIIIKKGD